MKTAILLATATSASASQFYRQDGGLGSCWTDCGAGQCDDFCGEGGFCCGGVNNWKGLDNINDRDCPQAAIDSIVSTVFRCAIPSEEPKPDQKYAEGDQGYCWDTCKGGGCDSFCGKGGYCCGGENNWKGLDNIDNGDCPANAIDAVTANEFRCAVPVAEKCVKADAAEPLEDDEYKIIPAASAKTFNWQKARQECKKYGKHWDLVIFNNDRELARLQGILEDNCINDHAYWIGYREENKVVTTQYGQFVKATAGYQATTSIDLPWAAGEPNDNLGSEKCVRYNAAEGTVNDAICGRTWTGAAKDGVGMGIICEKHNPCEQQRGEKTIEWENKKYYISKAQFINANDAKIACQARGKHWDLAVIEDKQEHTMLNNKLGGCVPYWLGMTNPSGTELKDHQGLDVTFAQWDTHLGHGHSPNEPNDVLGDETCVRMRGGMYNDALCGDSNGFNKNEMQGYICKYQFQDDGEEECLDCNHNVDVLPWNTLRGCQEPTTCEEGARLEIVDAWKIGNGKNRPTRYGFAGKIKIPEDAGEFSILIRFSKKVTHGHFQLWNMNFWNFYNGGYEVLIHSKWWNTDRHDPDSVLFLAEELNSDEYPELVYWTGHQKKHSCFQPSMHQGAKSLGTDYDRAVQEAPHVYADTVTSVRFKNGRIVKVRGRGRHN